MSGSSLSPLAALKHELHLEHHQLLFPYLQSLVSGHSCRRRRCITSYLMREGVSLDRNKLQAVRSQHLKQLEMGALAQQRVSAMRGTTSRSCLPLILLRALTFPYSSFQTQLSRSQSRQHFWGQKEELF